MLVKTHKFARLINMDIFIDAFCHCAPNLLFVTCLFLKSDPSSHGHSSCWVEPSLYLHSSKAHKLLGGDFSYLISDDYSFVYFCCYSCSVAMFGDSNSLSFVLIWKLFLFIQETFRTKDDYFKAIGYKEENGKIESTDDFLERLNCYMKLYGALVQVCCSYPSSPTHWRMP